MSTKPAEGVLPIRLRQGRHVVAGEAAVRRDEDEPPAKELAFVTAARALGAGPLRAVRRHVLPHALRPPQERVTQAPHLLVFPSLFLVAAVLAIVLLGEGPRHRPVEG